MADTPFLICLNASAGKIVATWISLFGPDIPALNPLVRLLAWLIETTRNYYRVTAIDEPRRIEPKYDWEFDPGTSTVIALEALWVTSRSF